MKISVEEVQIIISLLDKKIKDKNSFLEDLEHIMYVNDENGKRKEKEKRGIKKRIDKLCILRTKLKEAKIVI